LTIDTFQLRKARQTSDMRSRNRGVIFKVKFNAFHTSQRLIELQILEPDRRDVSFIVKLDSTWQLLKFGNQASLFADVFQTVIRPPENKQPQHHESCDHGRCVMTEFHKTILMVSLQDLVRSLAPGGPATLLPSFRCRTVLHRVYWLAPAQNQRLQNVRLTPFTVCA
jgi:hypothetical protein